jgi:hypothetical protein
MVLPIGDIWQWIEYDGSLVVRWDGLKGPINKKEKKNK